MEDVTHIMAHQKKELDAIVNLVSSLTTDDIPTMGKILNVIDTIVKQIDKERFSDYVTIAILIRQYVEKVILEEVTSLTPVIEGLTLLQAMSRQYSHGNDFTFGLDHVIEMLGGYDSDTDTIADAEDTAEKKPPPAMFESSSVKITELDQDDMEVIGDFIMESRENLETIEVNLINLEENPDDKDIINAIFRPFHTIKGISGFLDMRKINLLSHATENLLDGVRNGNFSIDHEITDVILQSVDILKKLIGKVHEGHKIGMSANDTGIEIDDLVKRIEKMSGSGGTMRVGEILVKNGVIDEEKVIEALSVQQENPEKKLGEILIEDQGVDSSDMISALREQKRTRKAAITQIKVDTVKLDNLVDLTGELVIAQSMLRQEYLKIASSGLRLSQNMNQLSQIVSNIQKTAMSMRMVPINATFQKMVRLVRDLAKNCKKDVALSMAGEETEIDRNVVEALYEPMVHMIRNSIDHGLESVENRRKAGKPEKGSVNLKAYHKGGNIVIEISDDGKGLNKVNILEKAISLGLVDPNADLSDKDIFQLIMKPGFSTAQAVTDISGRGVGMDVVKKVIEDLNGHLDIKSIEGHGSTFIITLPLTLAIIEGMLIRVGQERFIVPTTAILECFRPRKEDYFTVEGKGEMLMFRKSLIPVIRLNRICGVTMDHTDIWNNISIVVESSKAQRVILIDELLGKDEFVIKSLGESLKNVKGLAGGAILGDGKVGLILDIAGLFDVALS